MKKIAIITGANSGMGKEFALQLEQRYDFEEYWLIARNTERLKEVSNLLHKPCQLLSLDLSKQESLDGLNQKLKGEQPTVQILINGAGYGKFQRLDAMAYADAMGMIDLNDKALVAMTYMCLPYMSQGSQVVNIGSFSAFGPLPCAQLYAASKTFVLYFSRALNQEVKPKGIHVLCLCPMWVQTAFFNRANTDNKINKYPHLYQADYVVKKCIKAMSTKKDYVVPGLYAKLNHLMAKLLPNKLFMKVFIKQQNLKEELKK